MPRVDSRRRTRRERNLLDGSTEPDQDDADELESSIEDLIGEAEPTRFDRTFLASQDDFRIQGGFSPAPFPLQVVPRLAYTINYQMVYNEETGRWEPLKKTDRIVIDDRDDLGGLIEDVTLDQTQPAISQLETTTTVDQPQPDVFTGDAGGDLDETTSIDQTQPDVSVQNV